jgi:subtilase family serine protease
MLFARPSIILLAIVVAACTTANATTTNVLHAKHAPNMKEWMVLPQHSSSAMQLPFTFRLSMKQRNVNKLKQIALERSNPRHEKYGQYLKQAEIDRLTLPTTDDINVVQTFIEKQSSHKCSVNAMKEILEVVCDNAYVVEDLLKTKFHVLQNKKTTSQSLLRATDFYLPKYVDTLVQGIYGLHGLPLPPREEKAAPPAQPASVTPSVIKQVYHISDAKVSGSSKNRQAVAEFQGQTM